jgi:hypothetical protein
VARAGVSALPQQQGFRCYREWGLGKFWLEGAFREEEVVVGTDGSPRAEDDPCSRLAAVAPCTTEDPALPPATGPATRTTSRDGQSCSREQEAEREQSREHFSVEQESCSERSRAGMYTQ